MKTFRTFIKEKNEVKGDEKKKPSKKMKKDDMPDEDEDQKPIGQDKIKDVIDVKPKMDTKTFTGYSY